MLTYNRENLLAMRHAVLRDPPPPGFALKAVKASDVSTRISATRSNSDRVAKGSRPSQAPKQSSQSRQLCRYFSERGSCREGDSCRFVHDRGLGTETLGIGNLKKRREFRNCKDLRLFLSPLRDISPDFQLEVLVERQKDIAQLLSECDGIPPNDVSALVDICLSARAAFQRHQFNKFLETLTRSISVVVAEYMEAVVTPAQLQKLLEFLLLLAQCKPTFIKTVDPKGLNETWSRCQASATQQERHENESLLAGLNMLRDKGTLRQGFQPEGHELDTEDVLPLLEELLNGVPKNLPQNQVDNGWGGFREEPRFLDYRRTHFMLLREEMLSPLREAMVAFMERGDNLARSVGTHFYAYEIERATQFKHSMGWRPCLDVQFKSRRRMDFSAGSHLIYGSLVALFEVCEENGQRRPVPETLLFATVEDFSLEKLSGDCKEVGLAFIDSNALSRFDFQQRHVMLESPSYFAAFQPVFEWLLDRHMLPNMPLAKELLCGADEADLGVGYLNDVAIDLDPLYQSGWQTSLAHAIGDISLNCSLAVDADDENLERIIRTTLRDAVRDSVEPNEMARQLEGAVDFGLSGKVDFFIRVFLSVVMSYPQYVEVFTSLADSLTRRATDSPAFTGYRSSFLEACQQRFCELLSTQSSSSSEGNNAGMALIRFIGAFFVKDKSRFQNLQDISDCLMKSGGTYPLTSVVEGLCELYRTVMDPLKSSSVGQSLLSKLRARLAELKDARSESGQLRYPACLRAEIDSISKGKCKVGQLVGNPLHPWPHTELLQLDPSQQLAVQHALRNRIALIQGPPGTGKSYVGEKLVRLLRQALDFKSMSAPILVVCLTNHALDQFLEDLLPHYPALLRLGGRSKSENEALLKRQLTKVATETKDEAHEMALLRTNIKTLLQVANRSKSILSDGITQAMCVVAAIPKDTLHTLVSGVTLLRDEMRSTKPANITAVVTRWLEAWRRGEEATVSISTDGSFQPTFTPLLENAPSQTPMMHGFGKAHGKGNSRGHMDDLDDLDFDIVRGLLDDRMEDGLGAHEDHDESNGELPSVRLDASSELTMSALRSKLEESQDLQKRINDWNEQVHKLECEASELRRQIYDWEKQKPVQSHPGWHDWSWWNWEFLQRLATTNKQLTCSQNQERQVSSWKKQLNLLLDEILRLRCQLLQACCSSYIGMGSLVQEVRSSIVNLLKDKKDIRELQVKDRDALWKAVVEPACRLHSTTLQEAISKAQQASKDLDQVRKASQLRACSRAPLIGMTSNFAALNRDLVHRIGSHLAIIEEAGELLEIQLMASLSSPKLEHLILIGDHQQLRPKINAFHIARKYKFDVSLFERRILQGCPSAQLSVQLRMRRTVCDLVRPFYSQIVNHPRVSDYPSVLGLAVPVFFWTHTVFEDAADPGAPNASKRNSHEAAMASRLTTYLVQQQQYKPHEITLLTPYLGQKRLLWQHLSHELKGKGGVGVKVATIDDYQGEENRVIILSLVRSNPENKLGFCGIENRVIVALSRAQHGLYILGNKSVLQSSKSWSDPLCSLEREGQLVEKLPLVCQNHPDMKAEIKDVIDFEDLAPDGGCSLACKVLLPGCGHHCPLKCHPFGHDRVACRQRCSRPRPAGCGHQCHLMCHECPGGRPQAACETPCQFPVDVTLDTCQHLQSVMCHISRTQRSSVSCTQEVVKGLSCGHDVKVKCGKLNSAMKRGELKCKFSEPVKLNCGHEVPRFCGTKPICKKDCSTKLACGHACGELCGSHEHGPGSCRKPCPRYLMCGHNCAGTCGGKCIDKCTSPCGITCVHGYKCSKRCWEACTPCREPCGWQCEHHKCSKLCFEECDRPGCADMCRKTLPHCGHPCRGLCGEPCPPCPQCTPKIEDTISMCPIGAIESHEKLYRLPDCGHTFFLESIDQYMAIGNANEGHVAVQLKGCPTCRKTILTAPRYNAIIKRQLKLIAMVKQRVTLEERREVDAAMRSDGSTSGGHWYACPQGHPYYIGNCGGAIEVRNCPEPGCGAQIGGSSHRLVEDNQYLADFTGERRDPAWPGVVEQYVFR